MVRIISGSARGIRIKTPGTEKTRPTLDMIKESVFNILMPYIDNTCVLDLFSGSGNLGIEALSRGAQKAVFVDNSRLCKKIILENLKKTKFENRSEVFCMDVFKALSLLKDKGRKFNLIFMDPPYNMNFIVKTLQMINDFDIISENGIIACEHPAGEIAPETMGKLLKTRQKIYGDTVYSFYFNSTEPE